MVSTNVVYIRSIKKKEQRLYGTAMIKK